MSKSTSSGDTPASTSRTLASRGSTTLNLRDLTADHMMAVLDAEVSRGSLVKHHIDSFNGFISKGLSQIVTQLFEIDHSFDNERDKTAEDQSIATINIHAKFTDVRTSLPMSSQYTSGKKIILVPNMARKNDLTYSSNINIDATITVTAYHKDGREEKRVENVKDFVLTLPVMVGSKVCHTTNASYETRKQIEEDPRDVGGYFIIRGGEWAITMVESRLFNYPHVFRNVGHEKEICRLEFISKPGDAYENSSELIIRYVTNGNIYLQFRSNRYLDPLQLPFYIIFRLFGMSTDKEIVDSIVYGGYGEDSVSEHMMQVLRKAMRINDTVFGEALYMTDPAQILDLLGRKSAFINQLKNTGPMTKTTDSAVTSLGTYITGTLLKILDVNVFPHIGLTAESRHKKLRFMGHLIHKLLMVEMQILPSTDRDSLKGKRLFAAGRAYARAFKTYFNTEFVQKGRKKLIKDFKAMPFSQVSLAQSFKAAIKAPDLEKAIIQEISSGSDESATKSRRTATRISSENMHRKNQLNVLSTLRVIRTPSTSASKQDTRSDEMRRVHPSYDGFICIIQSADTGTPVGLVKQLAISAALSEASSNEYLKKIILENPDVIPLIRIFPADIHKYSLTKILVNGDWIGCTRNGSALVRHYREIRRGYKRTKSNINEAGFPEYEYERIPRPEIYVFTGIHWDSDSNEINFWVDAGRMIRPLLVVRNNGELDSIGRSLIGTPYDPIADPPVEYQDEAATMPIIKQGSFIQDLVLGINDVHALYSKSMTIANLHAHGIVDYICPEEMENLLIAPSIDALKINQTNPLLQYTHCEIPAALLGLPALTCPFASHNQAPRITFQTNQSKQTCGWYALNYAYRVDKHAFLQYYCETPLIHTLANKYIYPNGMNEITAIDCYTGYNQEDSLVINITSSERGLYKGNQYNYTRAILEPKEHFGNPDPNNTMDINKHANYDYLVKGFVRPGTIVKRDDVIIGKMIELPNPIENYHYKDTSIIYYSAEPALIEDVIFGRNQEDKEFVKIKYSSARIVDVGSKFCLRPTAELLTETGWKQISKITSSDTIATLKSGTTLCYEAPTNIMTFSNDTPLYTITDTTAHINIVCTPEHKLYISRGHPANPVSISGHPANSEGLIHQETKFTLIDAIKACGTNYIVKHTAIWNNIKCITNSSNYDAIIELFGLWIVYGMPNMLEKSNSILFDGTDEQLIRRVRKICKALSATLHYMNNIYAIRNQKLTSAFRQLYGYDRTRIFPQSIWKMSGADSLVLLNTIIDNRSVYPTNNYQLANELTQLALHAGMYAYIVDTTTRDPLRVLAVDQNLPKYIVMISPERDFSFIGKAGTRRESMIPYTGDVHCVEVGEHIMYYRETPTSYPCWIGNSSRHGQKGVPAASFNQSDMIFTESGIIPDKVLSPFCIPTRMTIGQLIEGGMSKLCAISGTHEDATIFRPIDIKAIGDALEAKGYDRHGRERMYNGTTGEWIDCEIWCCPVYYQRLQKFVMDEVYSISTGPTDILTRQPLEGKSKNGGLRIGEMERDVLLSHGVGNFIMEKYRDDSDGFDVYVCRNCKRTPAVNEEKNIIICKTCQEAGIDADVVKARCTWGTKTFVQELESMGVGVLQTVEPYEYDA